MGLPAQRGVPNDALTGMVVRRGRTGALVIGWMGAQQTGFVYQEEAEIIQ